MNTKKTILGIAMFISVFALTVGNSYAAMHIQISGNAADSENRIRLNSSNRVNISQSSDADIRNSINVSANTGDNNHTRNNDGDVGIHTGDSNVHVGVSNSANTNFINFNHSNRNGIWNSDNNDVLRKFHTSLSGSEEVPGPGDPNGWGIAKSATVPSKGKFCIAMQVGNIDPATDAHVHKAPKGQSGPVVIHLPVPNANGYAKGCVDADMTLLQEIKDNPSNFYINVHNASYPNGAVRGQLSN